MREVTVGGFLTAVVSRSELAAIMVEDCMLARETDSSNRLPKIVFSSNGQGIALAARDEEFRRTMQQADIIHADGMSVVFASRMTGTPLPERVATTDFFHDAAKEAEEHGLSFFMLGGTEEENRQAVESIQRLYPKIKIAGRRNGYFEEALDAEVCQQIRESSADVLWVALGKPRQELWAVKNRELLEGVGWIKTCGGLYSFLSGAAPRAPSWAQGMGLEWAYRAVKEPKRLGVRYLTTNPTAVLQLITKTEWSPNRITVKSSR